MYYVQNRHNVKQCWNLKNLKVSSIFLYIYNCGMENLPNLLCQVSSPRGVFNQEIKRF